MAKGVFMPKLSSTMEEGTLLQWLKEEGDTVEIGEPLFEIMTDKINMEVESYEEGILLKKYFKEDDEIQINTIIGYIGEQGEEVPEQSPGAEGMTESEENNQEESTTLEPPLNNNTEKEKNHSLIGKVRATPAARRVAKENQVDLTLTKGSGPKGRIQQDDVKSVINKVTPLAKKIAAEKGVDLNQIEASDSDKKIQKSDVLKHIDLTTAKSDSKKSDGRERFKLKGMRKAVADKMVESTSNIPHVTLTSEVDMTHIIELRQSLLPIIEKQNGFRISYTEILMKATAQTLEAYPRVNASLMNDEIILNQEINMGLAVAVEDGLVVPSIKEANKKGLAKLTEHSKLLSQKARNGALTTDEMSGSTFSISNLGMYAIDGFTPIINPPETAILGVGRIIDKPVVIESEIVIRPMLTLSLSFDHRAIDGAPAAEFITEIKRRLEEPYGLLV